MVDLNRHLFEVECQIEGPASAQRFQLPSWIPGSYLLREFSRHVVSIEARSGDQPAVVEQLDHSTWCCRDAGPVLTVKIVVYALDESVRGAWLDRRRAWFNGPCLFLLPLDREAEEVGLQIEAPTSDACAEWRVATAMQPLEIDSHGFGHYQAADYDELLDHPVEIGDFESVDFEAGGVPHRFVVAGRFDSDLDRVAADLSRVCDCAIELFGAPPPFARYCFLGFATDHGFGGLEHRASSSLQFDRDDLPKLGETGVSPSYLRFLSLASHEYFHAWHVKRTKPAAFMPYKLDRRNHTRSLWVFEGLTSYYQELLLVRSGLASPQAFLRRIGELLTRVYRTPGRLQQTLADASFNAWDMLYKPEANAANAHISYYTKGAVAALALDLTLRTGSSGKTLDEVLKASWERYGATQTGVPEGGFEALAIEIGGEEVRPVLQRLVRGTEDPPLAELFKQLGVLLTLRAAAGANDKGGVPASVPPDVHWLGAAYQPVGDSGLKLGSVFDGGPAQRAGLQPGDVLIGLDRLRITGATLLRRLTRFETGERVTASFFRGDELLEAGLVIKPAPLDTCYLELIEDSELATRQRRTAWLGA